MARGSYRYLLLLIVCGAGCVPRQPPEPPAPPPAPTPMVLQEEEVKPLERPKLAILDINEKREKGSAMATVTGTVINRGTGPARDLTVTVSALDSGGTTLLSVLATPSSTRVAAGSTATFSVSFERPDGTDQYHVEAVGR